MKAFNFKQLWIRPKDLSLFHCRAVVTQMFYFLSEGWLAFYPIAQFLMFPHYAGIHFRLNSSDWLSSLDLAFQWPKGITIISRQIVSQNPHRAF